MLLTIAAGGRHPLSPNLEFNFADPEIHEDLYKLIKYSCDEICTTKEQSRKAMRLWSTFLEQMLSVPSRPLAFEESEAPVVSKNHATRSAETCSGERDGTLPTVAMVAKQSKPLANGHEIVSPDQIDSGRTNLSPGSVLGKEDASFCVQLAAKHTVVVDKRSGINGTVDSAENITSSVAALAIEKENVASVMGMDLSSGSHIINFDFLVEP